MTDQAILDHISSLPHARGTFKQLVRELGREEARRREELEDALDRLTCERGDLLELRSGHFSVTARTREFAVGRLNVHRDGYGFLIAMKPAAGRELPGTSSAPPRFRRPRDARRPGRSSKIARMRNLDGRADGSRS